MAARRGRPIRGQAVNVRGVGIVRSLEDIGNIVLTQQGGLPVLISDVSPVGTPGHRARTHGTSARFVD
jgi:Cu/Ag efflux pump CusA